MDSFTIDDPLSKQGIQIVSFNTSPYTKEFGLLTKSHNHVIELSKKNLGKIHPFNGIGTMYRPTVLNAHGCITGKAENGLAIYYFAPVESSYKIALNGSNKGHTFICSVRYKKQ